MVEEEDLEYQEAARRLYDGKGSMGNGAAMRITPLGIYYYTSEALYDKAQDSARVTHTHPIGIDGAALQAAAIAQTIGLNKQRPFSPQTFVEPLVAFARTTEFKESLARIPQLIAQDVDTGEVAATLGGGIAAHESVPFALFCFLKHPHSFLETILCAVLNDGDRDTMGAMAGALCGGYLGVEAIPHEWRQKLENNQHIETLARELAARAS
jgi:poly(ADP-ribose) glycohydrolase ARH3